MVSVAIFRVNQLELWDGEVFEQLSMYGLLCSVGIVCFFYIPHVSVPDEVCFNISDAVMRFVHAWM